MRIGPKVVNRILDDAEREVRIASALIRTHDEYSGMTVKQIRDSEFNIVGLKPEDKVRIAAHYQNMLRYNPASRVRNIFRSKSIGALLRQCSD